MNKFCMSHFKAPRYYFSGAEQQKKIQKVQSDANKAWGPVFAFFLHYARDLRFSHPQACNTRILHVSWQEVGGRLRPDCKNFKEKNTMRGSLCGRRKKGREGEKSAKGKRESNRLPFLSSSRSPMRIFCF